MCELLAGMWMCLIVFLVVLDSSSFDISSDLGMQTPVDAAVQFDPTATQLRTHHRSHPSVSPPQHCKRPIAVCGCLCVYYRSVTGCIRLRNRGEKRANPQEINRVQTATDATRGAKGPHAAATAAPRETEDSDVMHPPTEHIHRPGGTHVARARADSVETGVASHSHSRVFGGESLWIHRSVRYCWCVVAVVQSVNLASTWCIGVQSGEYSLSSRSVCGGTSGASVARRVHNTPWCEQTGSARGSVPVT